MATADTYDTGRGLSGGAAMLTAMLVVDDRDDPAAAPSLLGALSEEYAGYVAQGHAGCPDCPVARSGRVTARAMFAWKAVADGCLDRWTRGDVRAFLADHLARAASNDPRLAMDTATCVRDVVYFLTDRGTYRGEDVELIVAAAMVVIDDFVREQSGAGPSPQDEFALIEARLDEAVECDDYELVVELVERALTLPEAGPELAGFLDTLGWASEKLGRFDEAVDVMRRAAAAGLDTTFDEHPSTAALIAHLLLLAGRVEEAHGAWAEAETERPGDSWIHQAAGRSYEAVGRRDLALSWRTRGLRQALRCGEVDLIGILLEDRGVDDLLAADAAAFLDAHEWSWQRTGPARPATRVGARASVLAWFPPADHARALALWPSFAGEAANAQYGTYCARLERALQKLRHDGVHGLAVAPLVIDDYRAWCQAGRCDPELPDSRTAYAGQLADRGAATAWPPGRNDPCWCASGRKYKKCCLRAA